MLHWLTNALRGRVRLEAEGAFPERLLNLCAQRGVLFWNVEWLEPTRLRFTVTRRGWRMVLPLGEKAMCTVTRAGQSIVCLPARMIFQLEGGPAESGGPDLVIG